MVSENRSDVFEVLRENGSRLRSVRVEKIGVFGSFSRGEQDSSGDVDLLLVFRDGEKSFRNFMDARKILQEIFDRDVDVGTEESLKVSLRENVLGEVEYAETA
ncbi:nucleotidyltransferase [Nanohaloarchaea archaeon H01]|nr:nucleotidyltransferase [Nanohaloarchaea archaeon H01]